MGTALRQQARHPTTSTLSDRRLSSVSALMEHSVQRAGALLDSRLCLHDEAPKKGAQPVRWRELCPPRHGATRWRASQRPLWVGLEGDRIAFLTQPGSRKARNVERDPRVAISNSTVNGRTQWPRSEEVSLSRSTVSGRGWLSTVSLTNTPVSRIRYGLTESSTWSTPNELGDRRSRLNWRTWVHMRLFESGRPRSVTPLRVDTFTSTSSNSCRSSGWRRRRAGHVQRPLPEYLARGQ